MLLKHKEDLKSLCFLILTTSFVLVFLQASSMVKLATLPLVIFGILITNVINHNVTHKSLFTSSKLNSFLGVWISLIQGHSSKRIAVSHQLNHHVHYQGDLDWMSPNILKDSSGIIRIFKYFYLTSSLPAFSKRTPALSKIPKKWSKQMLLEKSSIWLMLACVVYQWGFASLVFLIAAQLCGVFLLVSLNLFQHDGCALQSEWGHSRNFTSKTLNFFFFNAGLHTAHHIDQTKHWSLLPKEHQKIKPDIPKNCIEPSFWVFFYRKYLRKVRSSYKANMAH